MIFNFFTYTACNHSVIQALLCLDMVTEYEHTDKIFSSAVPKVKPGIRLIFVNRETPQQDKANYPPGPLCTALEDEPLHEEQIPGVHCDK